MVNVLIIAIFVFFVLNIAVKYKFLAFAIVLILLASLYAYYNNFLHCSNVRDLISHYVSRLAPVNAESFSGSSKQQQIMSEIERKIPELIDYSQFKQDATKFIMQMYATDGDGPGHTLLKQMVQDLNDKVMRLYMSASAIVSHSSKYPQHNYIKTLGIEKDIKDVIHRLAFIGFTPLQEHTHRELLTQIDNLNLKLNAKLINIVNTNNGINGLYSTSGMPPSLWEPIGIQQGKLDLLEDPIGARSYGPVPSQYI